MRIPYHPYHSDIENPIQDADIAGWSHQDHLLSFQANLFDFPLETTGILIGRESTN